MSRRKFTPKTTMVYICDLAGHITVSNYDSKVGIEGDSCCLLCVPDKSGVILAYAADDLRKKAWKR